MQAIVVKFLGPTNTKPSRWSVSCSAKRIIVSKGHFCDTNDDKDARLAAEHLCVKLGWATYGALIEGGLPSGDRVYVFPETADAMKAALRRARPWLGKLIADGGHLNSVCPNDAIGALQQVEAALR